MAISAISSSATSAVASSNPWTDFRKTFLTLAQAINSGDLSGAQQAYSALTQLQSGNQGLGADPNNPLTQALNQIGQSLQDGDITGAQQALASLQQQTQGAHRHHHHHHGGGSADNGAVPAVGAPTDSTSTSSGSGVNLTA